MQTRLVGNTTIRASVIGLGCEHLDNQPASLADEVIGAALESGITLLDVFMPGETVRSAIGNALAGRRDKVCIQGAIGSVDLREQYDVSRDLDICKRYFENLLRSLKTDYIDFGMLFFLDTHADVDAVIDNGIVEYVRSLKKSGVIRAVGASSHNPAVARRLVEEGLVDMLMFSINPAFDLMPETGDILTMLGDGFAGATTRADPERAGLYRLCESRGIGITVMKGLGAGKLLSSEHSPFGKGMTPAQCIHYALTRPAVSSVIVGCRSREEVAAAVSYCSASEAERDYSAIVGAFRGEGGFRGSCLYCNHCLPCPANINIAAVTKYLDIARLNEQAIPPGTAQHYRALEAHGSDCVACGSCEERCPFTVPVIENMRKAAALFGQ